MHPINTQMKKRNKTTIIVFQILIALFVAAGAVALVVVYVAGGDAEKIVQVSGAVIDPVTDAPVARVDLAVGDTSIRTGEAGSFVFSAVSTKTGIRLTHPELLRAIVKLPDTREDEQVSDILFNVRLYNTLISIIDREARGNPDFVYDYLAPSVRERVLRQTFRDSFEPFYLEENITDQEVVLRSMLRNNNYHNKELDLRFKNVIEFELVNGKNSQWYRLVPSDTTQVAQWHLIL